jgi:hypothetical protein
VLSAPSDSVSGWIDEVEVDCENPAKVLLAAKSDIPMLVDRSLGVLFFEVSLKNDLTRSLQDL